MNLNLDTPPSFHDLYTAYPTGNGQCLGTQSNPQAQMFQRSYLYAYGSQGDLLGIVREYATAGSGVTPGVTYVMRLYATSAFAFKGVCTYTRQEDNTLGTEEIDVNVNFGWNAILVTPKGNSFIVRNAANDVQTALKFTLAPQSLFLTLNPDTLTFTNDNPVTVDASLVQIGGYSGTVTLSTDVPGLTVEPSTITLNPLQAKSLQPLFLTQKLSFKYKGTDTGLKRGFVISLKDAAGKEVGSGSGLLVVGRPGATIQPSSVYTVYNICRNEVTPINFRVDSLEGFSGAITVSLSGLPAGITAETKTVNVAANSYTTFDLQVRVSSAAALGTTPVTFTATSATASASGQLTLGVCHARQEIGSGPIPGATTGSSVWVRTGVGALDPVTNTYLHVVKRYSRAGIEATTSLPGFPSFTLPDGRVLAFSDTDSYLLSLDGTWVKGLKRPSNLSTQSRVMDAQGRIWFIGRVTDYSAGLQYWNPLDGSTKVVHSTSTAYGTPGRYDDTNDQLRISADGKKILYIPASNENPYLLDVASETRTAITAALSISTQYAVDNNGEIWFVPWASTQGLSKINLDGSVTTFTYKDFADTNNIVGFDKVASHILWLIRGEEVVRLDTTTMQSTSFRTGMTTSASTLPSGGVAVFTYDSMNGARYFVGFLP